MSRSVITTSIETCSKSGKEKKCPAFARVSSSSLRLGMIGVNYQTASVKIREAFAFSRDEIADVLRKFIKFEHIEEVMLLSTCNRTEVYLVSARVEQVLDACRDFLCARENVSSADSNIFYSHQGSAVAESLFKVCCGVESMILGETQITSQIKAAYSIAVGERTTGPLLNRLVHNSFRCAKQARNQTQIGAGTVSVGSAAVKLAGKVFAELAGKNVLLVGAGEAAELTASLFQDRGVANLVISNRTAKRAQNIARKLNAQTHDFKELASALSQADIVVCATGSPEPIISKKLAQDAINKHDRGILLIIDIAVPRDVEPEVGDIEGIFLHDIDRLGKLREDNINKRLDALPEVESIVNKSLHDYESWLRGFEISPLITQIFAYFEAHRQIELSKLPQTLNPEVRELAERITASLVKRLANVPVQKVKQAAERGEPGLVILDAIRFSLDIDTEKQTTSLAKVTD